MPSEEEWQTLARSGRRIWAAKVLAAQTGMGLEARDHVEDWYARNCLAPAEAAHRLCCLAVCRLIRQSASSESVFVAMATDTRSEGAEKPDWKDDGPDIAVWWNGEANRPPDLAVHVVLPSDGYSFVQARMRRFLKDGARMVWLATPELRTVIVYNPDLRGKTLQESDTLSGEDVLPGFGCLVADLFV